MKYLMTLLAAGSMTFTASSADNHQDFVFLTEARPILVRVHAHIDGKPVVNSWNDLINHLFAQLDTDKDGVLSKSESELIRRSNQIIAGGLGAIAGGQTPPKFEEVDTNKDGKVSRDELAGYYRTHGLAPFQFQLTPPPNPLAAAGLTNRNADPPVDAVAKAAFALVDRNNDGKLSLDELKSASSALLQRDSDEDEMITARELAPDAKLLTTSGGAMAMIARPSSRSANAQSNLIVPILKPGEAPPTLVKFIQERYGKQSVKSSKGDWFSDMLNAARVRPLSREQLGLDEATFKRLDTNSDGKLDTKELAGIVQIPPDLELTVLLGRNEESPRVEVKTNSLREQTKAAAGIAMLDLGVTRVEMRSAPVDQGNNFLDYIEQMITGLVKQADSNSDGIIDEKEAQSNAQFRNLIKAMDRDGDKKVTEQEINSYFADAKDLQARAEAASLTLVLTDQSRGLFDLLDANRDGRLSVRESRGAPALLKELDRKAKGHLVKEDLPRIYQVKFRLGAVDNSFNQFAFLAELYGNSAGYETDQRSGSGPLWLRKMDRNRDGDVSRKEFLFSDEQFRRLDRDGDGLISAEEAAALQK